MDEDDRRLLAAHYACLAAYYGFPLADHVVQMYVADLADLTLEDCMRAMHVLRRDSARRRCPLPAEVRAAAPRPSQPRAEQVAAAIGSAIARIGYTRPDAARHELGETAWNVVTRLGGWTQLCQTLTTAQMGTFLAQARELARTVIADRAVAEAAALPLSKVMPQLASRAM